MSLTIAVTGANGNVGRKLLVELRARGHRTIALVRHRIELPADTVVADWTTSPDAERALASCDAIVHLAGTLVGRSAADFATANVSPARRVVDAVRAGGARRLVCLSYPGADPASSNAYLRTKGEAERLLQDTGREVVVFRCTHIVDTPESPGPLELAYSAESGGTVNVLGSGRQRVRPILREDVVTALATATERGRPGVYALAGTEEMSADEMVRMLNAGRTVRIRHTPSWLAIITGLFVPILSPTFVAIASGNSTGDPEPAVREFGLSLTPVRSMWRPGAVRTAEMARTG